MAPPEKYNELLAKADALFKQQQFPQALQHYRKIQQLQKAHPNLGPLSSKDIYQLALLLTQQKHYQEAYDYLQQLHQYIVYHSKANYFSALGVCASHLKNRETATKYHEKAIALEPKNARFYNNMGVSSMDCNEVTHAIDAFEKAIKINKNLAEAHWNYARALLYIGEYKKGWLEYEWRHLYKKNKFVPELPAKPWLGKSLKNKSLLVFAEQGLGDGIQFSRYLPLIKKENTKIIVQVNNALMEIFKTIDGVDEVISRSSTSPETDYYIGTMSLPKLFKTTLENIPKEIPYFKIKQEFIKKWQRIIPNTGFNIGFSWRGSALNPRSDDRDIAFERFLALTKEATFYSFQLDLKSQEKIKFTKTHNMVDLAPYIQDFQDTAAAIEQLDLIISVDTALVHMAGARNKPVWNLVSFVADFRWLQTGTTTPWYPAMTLFRQPALGDWDSVFEDVKKALSGYKFHE